MQDWVTDVREARRNYGRAIVERLKELNLERGRIGITGLGEVEGTRTPEGTIFYGTWKQIREAFPHGEILQIGNPFELYRSPANALVAEFFGSINWLRGKMLDANHANAET